MTDYVLAGLAKRRAELAGEAETLRARLAQIATDTGHLDAVIRQFDPDYDLGSIRPKRPRVQDAAGRGDMSRFLMKVLREASEPVATHEVVQRLMTERGQDMEDRRLVKSTMKRVGMAFSRQKAAGRWRGRWTGLIARLARSKMVTQT